MIYKKELRTEEVKIQKSSKINTLKLLFLIFILSLFVQANEGPIGAKAIVSNTNIVSGDIVELHIRAIGNIAVFPTIKNIDGVKVLSRNERVTNMYIYTLGKLKRERTTLTLTFSPKKEMTIPSYKIQIDGKFYHTKPIHLKVKKASVATQKSNAIFSLKLKSNKNSVMTGESFLVTVTLFLKRGLYVSNKVQYIRPKFQGFFVEQLDKGKSDYNGAYQVTTLRYILTPHSEGNFTLGPAHAKIGLQNKGKQDILHVGLGRKWFKKASNTLNVEVLTQNEKPDLVGRFKLSAIIDTQETKASHPVKLTVNIKGEGNLAHFDFAAYNIEGVTVYSKDAKVDIKIVEGQIHSRYSKQFVFISEENFTIPEQRITMFDPKEGNSTTLKIKTYAIKIKTSKVSIAESNPAPTVEHEETTLTEKLTHIFTNYWMIILAFVLGILSFYLLRYLPKRKTYKESEALTLLYTHISEDPEVEEMVRKLYARENGDRSVKINKKRLKELVDHFR